MSYTVMKRNDLTSWLDQYLTPRRYQDRSNNGLQVQGPDEVHRVAFAVDACAASFNAAVAADAQLLIVHHGLFWSEHLQIVGAHFERVRTLIAGGCGLYASHLPLDAHAEVGNNAELARMAGLTNVQPWGMYKGETISFIGDLPNAVAVETLSERVGQHIGPPKLVQAVPNLSCKRVAVLSGFGVTMVDEALAAGADTLITGETSHSWYQTVAERPINVLYFGHYASETVGLKALARVIAQQHQLATLFIDLPTTL